MSKRLSVPIPDVHLVQLRRVAKIKGTSEVQYISNMVTARVEGSEWRSQYEALVTEYAKQRGLSFEEAEKELDEPTTTGDTIKDD